MPDLHLVPNPIPDAPQRALALDITQSFIVEAPAGSGKTGLLIQRFLKLLSGQDAPDPITDPRQVLAITFTRKATAEMKDRVLRQLNAADQLLKNPGASSQSASSIEVGSQDAGGQDLSLALAVLERDRQLGWNLLDNPARLNIRTIDSVSQDIASALPILSGSGGVQSPTDDSGTLYAEAARRTTMLLGGDDSQLTRDLELLLLHRDGSLSDCEKLIAQMLGTRDQWGHLVPLSSPQLTEQYLDQTILPQLNRALERAIVQHLTTLADSFPPPILSQLARLTSQMASLDGYDGGPSHIAPYAICTTPPTARADDLGHWLALASLLLTQSGGYRSPKGINKKTIGFLIEKHHTQQLNEIIDAIRDDEQLREALDDLRSLPPSEYPAEQWPVAKSLFRILSRALAELQLVFADRGQCDFTEVGLLARHALQNDSALDDYSTASGARLQHLLVDEMQDTSTSQYEFIQLLTRRWDAHSQTVFLVGDPKQSIYLFRQARVERFLQTLQTARLGDLPLEVLRLTANFRSQPQLVHQFNQDFSLIFPNNTSNHNSNHNSAPHSSQSHRDESVPSNQSPGAPSQSASSIEVGSSLPNSIPYTPAHPIRTGLGTHQWHTHLIPYQSEPEATRLHAQSQAQDIRDIIQRCRQNESPTSPLKIAVLVRSRSHLREIVLALNQPTPIPYRAVEIDSLAERQEILDLLALTRALLHPADRTAWLALLRTPWCGLSLADIHHLASPEIDPARKESTLLDLLQSAGADLSPDGIARLTPFWTIIDAALQQRGRLRIAQWVQRTWQAFHAPQYLDATALTNAERFFQLLDELEAPGATLSLSNLQQKVASLYATPSTDPLAVDLMTLHKAKGLEWDVVLLPELQRTARKSTGPLLAWLETEAPEDQNIAPGILAPIGAKGTATHQLNIWMRSIEAAREAAERKRLFYVAATRAREELHLFAAPKRKQDDSPAIPADSLLHAAWPAAEEQFLAPILTFPRPAQLTTLALAANAPTTRTLQRTKTQSTPATPYTLPPTPSPFLRPEGNYSSRTFGSATHAFLELLAARIASGTTPSELLAELPTWQPRINAVLRASGLSSADIARHTPDILRALTKTLQSPDGLWILQPHPHAAAESALTTPTQTLRLDRTFLAGPTPLSTGDTHLWIIDYKTADHGATNLDPWLESQRLQYAPQLETYAAALAAPLPICLALYYPLLPRLIWWKFTPIS